MAALRFFLAFYDCEEEDLCKIVSAIVTNRIIQSTLQRRSEAKLSQTLLHLGMI